MWHDDSDADQPSAGERTERDPAGVDVVLERAHLGLDGVFAVTVRVPRRRAPVAVPRDEFGAALVVEHVDAFPTVYLGHARHLGSGQPSELDCRFHRLTLAHGRDWYRGWDSNPHTLWAAAGLAGSVRCTLRLLAGTGVGLEPT